MISLVRWPCARYAYLLPRTVSMSCHAQHTFRCAATVLPLPTAYGDLLRAVVKVT